MWKVLLMCPCLSKAESIEHRAWSIGKDRRQKTEDRGQKTEGRRQKVEDRDSTVGAAFSRDLAVSTNFLIF